jgi:hypothetical protein
MPVARILVVDDDATLRSVVVQLLSSGGHAAAAVGDGRLAVDEVMKDPPELLLTDVAMPGFDGLQVIGALRGRGAALPILAMSGGGLRGRDLAAAAAAGANGVLAKPFTRAELLSAVSAAQAASMPPAAGAAAAAARPRRVAALPRSAGAPR